ncbi:MAG: SDR family NAD(P)-dependent oxidoreductase [Muribaculaceae bacterium]|nr:SDR family NAD(P)-dependent oxidoreductase [Muribaculaceae bacterium]MDE6330491.1 SDR family NAD(P)-dependent oxidoreductase [Muribaculaceae bacterium]
MTAVVTGASGGIGLEFCRALARLKHDLVMVSIDDTPLVEAAAAIASDFGVKTYPLTIDLCREDAPDRIFAFLQNLGLDPDILINNAGIFSFAEVTDIPEAKIDAFISLHVRATTNLSVKFGRFFRKKGAGYILNMSSMSCWMPMPGLAMYSSTKAYIRAFSRALHYELRDYGVNVMVACPGGIATDLFGLPDNLKRLALRIGAIERPDRFARNAIKRLFKGKAQYINGLTNRLAILMIGMTPRAARMQVKRRLLDRGISRP